MTAEQKTRLIFRLVETAFSVNPRMLREKFREILAPLFREQTTARRLLLLSLGRLNPTRERHAVGRRKLITRVGRYLEISR